MQRLSEKLITQTDYKHFADSQTGSSGTYQRTLVEGKERAELQRSTIRLILKSILLVIVDTTAAPVLYIVGQ